MGEVVTIGEWIAVLGVTAVLALQAWAMRNLRCSYAALAARAAQLITENSSLRGQLQDARRGLTGAARCQVTVSPLGTHAWSALAVTPDGRRKRFAVSSSDPDEVPALVAQSVQRWLVEGDEE